MKISELIAPIASFLADAQSNKESADLAETIERKISISALTNLLKAYQSSSDQEANAENMKPLIDFLNDRWMRIRFSQMAYPYSEQLPLNKLALELASNLTNIVKNESGRYGLLMPTITVTYNAISDTRLSDKTLKLHQFVLSDDQTRFIDVAECLESFRKTGSWVQTSMSDGKTIPLTPNEIKRVINHSVLTWDYRNALVEYDKMKNSKVSVGSLLLDLANGLERGGIKGKGKEEEAAEEATSAIKRFSDFLDLFTEEEKKSFFNLEVKLFGKTYTFRELWFERIIPDKKIDLTDIRYCSNEISSTIRKLVQTNPQLYDIVPKDLTAIQKRASEDVLRNLNECETKLEEALKEENYKVNFVEQPNHNCMNDFFASRDFKNMLPNQKREIFSTLPFNAEIVIDVWSALKDANDKDLLLKEILTWTYNERILIHLAPHIPRDTFIEIAAKNYVLQKETFHLLTPEERKKVLSLTEDNYLRDSLHSPLELQSYLTDLKDPELIQAAIKKLGREFIRVNLETNPREGVRTLIKILSLIPNEKQFDVALSIGMDVFSKCVFNAYPTKFGSNFKTALKEFNELEEMKLSGRFSNYDQKGPNEKQKIRHEYEGFLKVMAFAYLSNRDNNQEQYQHGWGNMFGAVDKSKKMDAIKCFISVIDGDKNGLMQLATHKKALEQGDLGELFKTWWNVKTNIFKEKDHLPSPDKVMQKEILLKK